MNESLAEARWARMYKSDDEAVRKLSQATGVDASEICRLAMRAGLKSVTTRLAPIAALKKLGDSECERTIHEEGKTQVPQPGGDTGIHRQHDSLHQQAEEAGGSAGSDGGQGVQED